MRHVHKLHLMLDSLISLDCIKPEIRCLHCGRSLVWSRENISEEMFFRCSRCIRSPNLLRVCLKDTAEPLLQLFDTENIQLVASALYVALDCSRYMNPISPPSVPDDPVDMLRAFKERSPSGFKLGGGEFSLSSIVIADLYEMPNCPEYAVLIVSDTEMVPTRYYLHAMHFYTEWSRETKFAHLMNELTKVSNTIIKPESTMVLGPYLQNWINEETYAREEHNLKLIVSFDELIELDGSPALLEAADVSENFNEIIRDAVAICDSVREVFELDVSYYVSVRLCVTKLQLYLSSAIWMRLFLHTPFKCYFYHCISDTIFEWQ